MKYVLKLISLSLIFSFIWGCSSSDGDSKPPAIEYTGKLTPATITQANSKTLSISSTEASSAYNSADAISSFKTGSDGSSDIKSIVMKTVNTAASYASEDASEACSSGSITVDGIDPNIQDLNTPLDLTIIYSNCTLINSSPTIKVDGRARFQGIIFGDFIMTFTNFTITEGNQEPQTINMTLDCSGVECSITTDIKGADGRIYRVVNLTVSGSDFSGYEISGRVYDPNHGYIDITTNSLDRLFFECTNGRPSSGQIMFDDGTNSVTVTYNSCTQYTVDFNGNANLYNW